MISNGRPLVTIAIPTYNRANGYLPGALEAALAQTYTPLEILVSDNCSTDRTPELVRSYDDSRVRYVRHEPSLGALGNFQYCVDAAEGDFFLMLHDDDRIDADFVETCVSALPQSSGVGYVRTGTRLIDAEGTATETFPNGAAGTSGVQAVLEWMQSSNYWTFSSTLYETDVLRQTGGIDVPGFPLTCDCHATARIALRGGGVEIEPVKASFRLHEENITNKVDALDWIDEWHRLHKAILSWAPTEHDRRMLSKHGRRFFSMLSYQFASDIAGRMPRLRAQLSVLARFRRLPPSIGSLTSVWRTNVRPWIKTGRTRNVQSSVE